MEIPLSYILSGGAAILVALYYLWTKKNSAEALNENLEVKKKVNELDGKIAKNNGQLTSEEEKRKELEKQAEDKKNEDSSNLIDFFRRRR